VYLRCARAHELHSGDRLNRGRRPAVERERSNGCRKRGSQVAPAYAKDSVSAGLIAAKPSIPINPTPARWPHPLPPSRARRRLEQSIGATTRTACGRVGDIPMLDHIVVDVIYVPSEVPLVPDDVLPVTPLPQAARSSAGTASGNTLSRGYPTGEAGFDQARAGRNVVIGCRQTPDAVQAHRQDNDRLHVDGGVRRAFAERRSARRQCDGSGDRCRGNGTWAADWGVGC
jgi:hypothetical protein